MEKNKQKTGLSDGNRKFIVFVSFVLLFIYAPLFPDNIIIRSLIFFGTPVSIWLFLKYQGKDWSMNKMDNDTLTSVMFGIIAGMFLLSSYSSFSAKYHTECDQYARSGKGEYECVGDYKTAKGPDRGEGIMKILFAAIAIKLALAKKEEDES